MARQSQNNFIKRQKELERIRKASEKMAKRQKQKKDDINDNINSDNINNENINIEKEIE